MPVVSGWSDLGDVDVFAIDASYPGKLGTRGGPDGSSGALFEGLEKASFVHGVSGGTVAVFPVRSMPSRTSRVVVVGPKPEGIGACLLGIFFSPLSGQGSHVDHETIPDCGVTSVSYAYRGSIRCSDTAKSLPDSAAGDACERRRRSIATPLSSGSIYQRQSIVKRAELNFAIGRCVCAAYVRYNKSHVAKALLYYRSAFRIIANVDIRY
ncbi:MAG: hypothetical protein JWL77_5490 [Chthonomonadaceae bacterium]|nr:hypothetical protein [Chthonomonadaceae bacterium]